MYFFTFGRRDASNRATGCITRVCNLIRTRTVSEPNRIPCTIVPPFCVRRPFVVFKVQQPTLGPRGKHASTPARLKVLSCLLQRVSSRAEVRPMCTEMPGKYAGPCESMPSVRVLLGYQRGATCSAAQITPPVIRMPMPCGFSSSTSCGLDRIYASQAEHAIAGSDYCSYCMLHVSLESVAFT